MDMRQRWYQRVYCSVCTRSGRLCVVLLCLFTMGCSTTVLDKARLQYASGDAQSALQTLGDGSEVPSRDKLLYWLERGLILHEEGNYAESSRELLNAAAYLEDNDFVSISAEARSLLANDWIRKYKGEYSEQLWIHTYLMMNFLSLGRYDSAAVEARRALERISDRENVLQHDAFTRALIGLSFESAGQANSAYIEYRKLADLTGKPGHSLTSSLYALAKSLGFDEDARKYKRQMAQTPLTTAGHAEVVLFLATGRLPEKISSSLITDYDERVAFPQYLPDRDAPPVVTVSVDGVDCDCSVVASNLGQLARSSLNSRGIALTTRLLARAAAKDALADNLAKKDEVVGEIARLLLFVLEEADTRGWHSLPGHLSLLRVPVNKGSQEIVVKSFSTAPTIIDVSTLQAGERRFIAMRERGFLDF